MADPITTAALVATIYYCVAGSPTNQKCPDGSDQHSQTVTLLVQSNDTHDIVEIDMNGKRVYTLHDDGTVSHAKEFQADNVAANFWKSLRDELPAVCSVAVPR